MYFFFCHQSNALTTSEIPMALVDIHDVTFVGLCLLIDYVDTASPLLYCLTVLNPHVVPLTDSM